MGVKSRLLEFVKSENIAVSEFERRAGLGNGYVSKERKHLSKDKIPYIKAAFPNLNINWVETGAGEMLIGNSVASFSPHDEIVFVPVLNLDARGGFKSNDCCEPEYTTTLMPFSREIAREDDVVIQIYGDSMSPKYPSGSMVLVRKIEMWTDYIEYGGTYVIELKDQRRIIKSIHKSENKDSFRLVSINPDYEPSDIPKALISMVFRVIMSIQRESL